MFHEIPNSREFNKSAAVEAAVMGDGVELVEPGGGGGGDGSGPPFYIYYRRKYQELELVTSDELLLTSSLGSGYAQMVLNLCVIQRACVNGMFILEHFSHWERGES